jgi:hypothetical protein
MNKVCSKTAEKRYQAPISYLVTSPMPDHAMRTDAPLPGTVLGKALESLEEGAGTIKVLVMLR